MLRKRFLLALIPLVMLFTGVVGVTDLIQTIPGIGTGTANGAVAGCTSIETTPGSFVPSVPTSILATCPNNIPAVILGGSETPSFTLAVGYDQAAIVLHNSSNKNPCGFNFPPVPGPNVPSGANLTSTGQIVFSPSPIAGQLLNGGYDYCLHVSSSVAVTSFTITWTP